MRNLYEINSLFSETDQTASEVGQTGRFTQRVSYLAYDSVWAVAQATAGVGGDVSDFVPLNISSMVNRKVGESINQALAATLFQGLTVSTPQRCFVFC